MGAEQSDWMRLFLAPGMGHCRGGPGVDTFDTLTALEQDAEAVKAAAKAADAAKVTLDLAQRQWQSGYAGYLALLSAQQAYQQARINLIQAQANRFADTAALFQALGGGWWHRVELAKDTHEK